MERRNFLKLTPALPAAAPMVALSIKQPDGSLIQADVAVLRVHPGDVIVLMTKDWIPSSGKDYLSAHIRNVFPEASKILVLEHGMEIGVMRPEA